MCFSVIFSLPIDPNPVTALFGILPESVQLKILQAVNVAFATLLARRLILMNWKSAAPPPYRDVFLTFYMLSGEDSVRNKTKA